MCSGIEFLAAGPACQKARSPNLVRSCGSENSVDDADLRRDTIRSWRGLTPPDKFYGAVKAKIVGIGKRGIVKLALRNLYTTNRFERTDTTAQK